MCVPGMRCGSPLDWGSHTFPQQSRLALAARPYKKQKRTPYDYCWAQTSHDNSDSHPRKKRGREMLGRRALDPPGKHMSLWEGSS